MRRVSLFLSDDLLAGLERLKVKHGTPQAESIRRAIAAYLRQQGASGTAKKNGGSRKKESTK
jgi:hypothetical protein